MGSKRRYETREAGRGQARLGKELQLIPGTKVGHQMLCQESDRIQSIPGQKQP